jgi:translation initiation factor IF-2
MPAAGRGGPPAPWTQTRRSPPQPPRQPPQPRTASARRRRTGRPPPDPTGPPAVAGPSPPPGSTAAPSGARSPGTSPRTARAGTAEPAPGPGTGTPTPRAAPPRTSGHQQQADPGGATGVRGSQRVLRVGDKAPGSLPAQQVMDESEPGQRPVAGLREPLLCRTDRAFRIVCDQARAPRSPPSRSGRPFGAQPVIYGVSSGRPADSPST